MDNQSWLQWHPNQRKPFWTHLRNWEPKHKCRCFSAANVESIFFLTKSCLIKSQWNRVGIVLKSTLGDFDECFWPPKALESQNEFLWWGWRAKVRRSTKIEYAKLVWMKTEVRPSDWHDDIHLSFQPRNKSFTWHFDPWGFHISELTLKFPQTVIWCRSYLSMRSETAWMSFWLWTLMSMLMGMSGNDWKTDSNVGITRSESG